MRFGWQNSRRRVGASLECLLIPSVFVLFLSFDRMSLLLGADWKRGGSRFGWGRGHSEGCW